MKILKKLAHPAVAFFLVFLVVIVVPEITRVNAEPEPLMTEQEYQFRVKTLQLQVLQSEHACLVDQLTQRVEYLEAIVSSKISRPDPTKLERHSAFPCVDNSGEARDELYELTRFKSHFTGTGEKQ